MNEKELLKLYKSDFKEIEKQVANRIRPLVELQLQAQREFESIEQKYKTAKQYLTFLEEHVLNEILMAEGIDRIEIEFESVPVPCGFSSTGVQRNWIPQKYYIVRIDQDVKTSVKDQNSSIAYSWLCRQGYGDKANLVIHTYPFLEINSMTLKSAVRKGLESGTITLNRARELFGAYQPLKAVITEKKSKK